MAKLRLPMKACRGGGGRGSEEAWFTRPGLMVACPMQAAAVAPTRQASSPVRTSKGLSRQRGAGQGGSEGTVGRCQRTHLAAAEVSVLADRELLDGGEVGGVAVGVGHGVAVGKGPAGEVPAGGEGGGRGGVGG